METAIQLQNLTRDFGSVRALDSLSLEVPSGTIFGFLGPNGSGKTTTINLMLGLLEPTDGCAEVLGFDTRTHAGEVRTRAGALLEHHGLYEQMTAEDNLAFYGRVWRLPDAERQARIKELLTHMGMWERRKDHVGTWSRGMKQKLALDRLEADLRYLAQRLPGVKISFHDPNFAVRFDETLDVLERATEGKRSPYIMESSLAVIRGPRLRRLGDTSCIYIAPGIESWSAYPAKAGVGQ